MNAKRRIVFMAGSVVLLIIIAAVMFVVGRGHTVYLDSKTFEYNGQTYTPPYRIVITVNEEQIAKLYNKERGQAICIGPIFTMSLGITETQGGNEETTTLSLRLPYSMDGIIINLPALLAGLPEEAYLEEFVVIPVVTEDEEIITDEFSLPEDTVLDVE